MRECEDGARNSYAPGPHGTATGLCIVAKLACHVSMAWLLASSLVACRQQERSREGAPAPEPTAAAQVKAQSGTPTIDFDTRVHDFGLVNEGTPIRHVFQVRNKGTAPLALSSVATSCGCTSATLDVNTIPPGGSGPLEVVMDTHGERGPGTRTITLSSNDPRQPTSTLEITYDVERLLNLDRSYAHLSTSQGTDRVERFWLTGQLVKRAKIRVVESDGDRRVTARTIEKRESGQLRKGLELKLYGNKPGSGEGVATIMTGLPVPAELSLRFDYAVN